MTLFATFLASKFGVYVVGLIAVLGAFVGTWIRAKHLGAAAERAKQASEERRAIETATVQRKQVDGMTPEQIRKELAKRAVR